MINLLKISPKDYFSRTIFSTQLRHQTLFRTSESAMFQTEWSFTNRKRSLLRLLTKNLTQMCSVLRGSVFIKRVSEVFFHTFRKNVSFPLHFN